MTLNELILQLIQIQNQGKGDYKINGYFWSDFFDISNFIIDDKNKEIIL